MCRFIVYKGVEPIQMSHLVTRPRHSIINQAFESKLRLPSTRPMNADGFGIGWYDAQSNSPPQHTFPAPTASPAPEAIAPANNNESPTGQNNLNETLLPKGDSEASPSSSLESGKGKAPVEMIRANINGAKPEDLLLAPEKQGLTESAEDLERKREFVRKREEERELEQERPCVFKSLSPAWSNANLTRLAEKIRSPLIFAHVRASTNPGAPSEDNCHPWMFDKLMWMHNGEIDQFPKIKRALQQSLPEELFLYPSGYTDSEWAFMVFLSMLKDPHARSFTHVELRDAMMNTIHFINKLRKEAGVTAPSLLNFVITDGHTVVATRYISSRTSEASSLFFSSGTSFDEYQEGGLYRMTKADKRENIIMISSEPLTFERSDWMEVKTNTMLVITPKMNLLQIPIIDEYWVPPQDPASHTRSKDYAIQMGFGYGFATPDQPVIKA